MFSQYLIFSLLAILASLILGTIGLAILILTIDNEKNNGHPAMTEEQVEEIIKNTKK